MSGALAGLTAGGFSIGLELPLDNDWSAASRAASGKRLPGEPDMRRHAALAKLADTLGYRALWVRDVPLYDPAFGDAAQVYEVFTYLGYLAGITSDILLGTAAVALPLREPLLTMKAAASIDRLSAGRLLLGIASGDRPIEYPLFGRDFGQRGQRFREHVAMLRQWGGEQLPPGVRVLPAPEGRLPLLVAGLAQQTPAWLGAQMDGCLAYPGTPDDHAQRAAAWRAVAGKDKPYVSFFHLDLADAPDAPMQRFRFGGRVGRNGLVAELASLRDAGVRHIGLHLRRTGRPLDEALAEIGEFVLPEFHAEACARELGGHVSGGQTQEILMS